MKKLLSLLMATMFALSLSFATFAEDKPADKKPATTDKKKAKKAKKQHTEAPATDKKAK